MKSKPHRVVWGASLAAVCAAGLATSIAIGQSDDDVAPGSIHPLEPWLEGYSWGRRITGTADYYGLPNLGGTWVVASRTKEPTREECARFVSEHIGEDGRLGDAFACRISGYQLKLTPRALAWFDFADEAIKGRYWCVPEAMPGILVRPYPVRIDQRADKITMEYQLSIHQNATRTVWLDGRRHPSPGSVTAHYGYSIGHYEGDELVVVTQGFSFDPDGIDYISSIPSGWRKKITERYSLLGPDRLKMDLTLEDPEFLREPYTETIELRRSRTYDIAWTHCDPEAASVPVYMAPPRHGE